MGNLNLNSVPFYDLEKAGARIKEILNKAESSEVFTPTEKDTLSKLPSLITQALQEAKDYADGMLALNDAMVFKGVISAPSDVWDNIVPANKWSAGWTWKIGYKMNSSNDLYGFAPSGSTEFEVGDLLIAIKDHPKIAVGYSNIESLNDYFVLISANADGSVTSVESDSEDGEIPVFAGTNGRVIKKSGTNIREIETNDNKGKPNGYVGLDEKGHIQSRHLPEDVVSIKGTRNLFDVDSVTYPGFLDYETGDVTVPTFEEKEKWLATDFIPVESGKHYVATRGYRNSFARVWVCANRIAYYDKGSQYISGESNVEVNLITPPTNASYMRIGFHSANHDSYDLKLAKYMVFEVNENWKAEEITGAFYVPFEKIKVDDEPDVYDKDYYSYSEVLTEGYLPNPDSGVNIWSGGNEVEAKEMTNRITDSFKPAQVYLRGNWSSAYDEENSKYSFVLWEKAIKQAIDLKTRAQLGIFGNLYPYYDSAGHVVSKTVNGEEAAICYSFPTFVFEKAYESDEYPLKLIRYNQNTYDGLPLYNAVIDWRNKDVQEYYRTALERFASFLKNNEYNGIKYKDAVSAIQIRFWGKWGEGHNVELYELENLEDSETLKSIVDMYINAFPDIRLVAPRLGSAGSKSIDAGHADWQKYYYTASNNVGKFGFFIDHVGSCLTQEYPEDYDGWNIRELMAERYKVAPITGEAFNNGQYDNSLITLPWLINDIMKNHISAVWYRNVTGVGKTPDYKYISTRDMFKRAYDMTGYRLFLLPVCNYVEDNAVNVQLRVGNMGVAPVYADYWNAQLVIRDEKGNEQVIDNIFDVRDVPLMPDVLVPSWKDCRVISVTENCVDGVDYANATYYVRIVDTKDISENMYFANIGRTEDGEYNLISDCSEDSTLMEDDTLLETDKLKECTLFSNALKGTASGAVVALSDVSPVEHEISCVVRSKNLLAYPYHFSGSKTINGVAFTNNGDGSITVNGTATDNAGYALHTASKPLYIPKGTTITAKKITDTTTGLSFAVQRVIDGVTAGVIMSLSTHDTTKVTDCDYHYVYLYVNAGATIDNITVYPQIEEGEEATGWAPYIPNISAVKAIKTSKNLCPKTSLTVSGTGTYQNSGCFMTNIQPGNYVAQAQFNQVGTQTTIGINVRKVIRDENGSIITYENMNVVKRTAEKSGVIDTTATITEIGEYQIQLFSNMSGTGIATECKFSNIQFELGEVPTEFEAYIKPIEYTPNSDGVVEGMVSIAPNMTIMTDTANAYVDVTYNRDINKAFEDKIPEIPDNIVYLDEEDKIPEELLPDLGIDEILSKEKEDAHLKWYGVKKISECTDVQNPMTALVFKKPYLYVGDLYNAIHKIDYTDIANPVKVAENKKLYALASNKHNITGIAEYGDYVFACSRDSTDGLTIPANTPYGSLYVLNKSDLSLVRNVDLGWKGSYVSITNIPNYGNVCIVNRQMHGFNVYKVDELTDPAVTDLTCIEWREYLYGYDNLPDTSTTGWNGEWQGARFYKTDDKVYYIVASFQYGISIYDITNPEAISLVYGSHYNNNIIRHPNNYSLRLAVFDVEIYGGYVYAPVAPITSMLPDYDYRGIVRLKLSDMIANSADLEVEYYEIDKDDYSEVFKMGDYAPSKIRITNGNAIVNTGSNGLAIFAVGDTVEYRGTFPTGESEGLAVYPIETTNNGVVFGADRVPSGGNPTDAKKIYSWKVDSNVVGGVLEGEIDTDRIADNAITKEKIQYDLLTSIEDVVVVTDDMATDEVITINLARETKEVVVKTTKSVEIVFPEDYYMYWRVFINTTQIESSKIDVGFNKGQMFATDFPIIYPGKIYMIVCRDLQKYPNSFLLQEVDPITRLPIDDDLETLLDELEAVLTGTPTTALYEELDSTMTGGDAT